MTADETNPLVDHPTVRLLRGTIPETESGIALGDPKVLTE